MISLIKHKTGQTVSYDKFAFSVANGELEHNECSRAGCLYRGNIEEYRRAYELCLSAWADQVFDEIIDNT